MNSGRSLLAVALALALAIAVYATVYSYRYAGFNIHVGGPAVWFEDPATPGVVVTLHREGTLANITVNAMRTLLLEHRSAVYYDTFDTNPFTARRLVAQTCTWGYDATAGAINISAGSRGPRGWSYWCVVLVNPNVLNITPYVLNGSTVYVAFLFWRSSFDAASAIRVDAVYLNSTARFYAIGYRSVLLLGRTGDSVYSNISFINGTALTGVSEVFLGTSLITEYDYMYHVSSAINFTEWRALHYVNVTYTRSAIIPPASRYNPYAVGIGYWVNMTGVTGTVYYDNLIVTVNHPPWYVNVTGVPDGWSVVLKNATGHVVASAVSSGGVARLVVAMQGVVDMLAEPYNRNALIIPNATLEVYDEVGGLIVSRTFDVVLGGDRYKLVSLFEGVVLSVYSNLTTGFWSMLANTTSDLVPRVNATLALATWNGSVTPENISVINGVVVRWETSPIYVEPPPAWVEKWLVANVTARFELPVLSIYNLRLNYVFWISSGVIALYAVNITAYG